MQTTRTDPIRQIHRSLHLKVKGRGVVADGDWHFLMKVAVSSPDRDWEIVECLDPIGVRVITKHTSLLSSDPSFLLKKTNTKRSDEV